MGWSTQHTPCCCSVKGSKEFDFLENEYSLVRELYKNGTILYVDFQIWFYFLKNQHYASKIHSWCYMKPRVLFLKNIFY